MSHECTITESTLFWIAHNGTDIVHYGKESVGVQLATGQPILETYAECVAWGSRLTELGVEISDFSEYME